MFTKIDSVALESITGGLGAGKPGTTGVKGIDNKVPPTTSTSHNIGSSIKRTFFDLLDILPSRD